ncbi:hypothetical protein [Psychromonas sp. Urea-02u-13]|uniref:hypothetical protein n=1 Tax=Psychromonas sp. Urea-02u-13 TaxID=2058326 RepID=UPI0012FEA81F|nr:hypothetical protein [Psychromonas sp. Urea-02u-13]
MKELTGKWRLWMDRGVEIQVQESQDGELVWREAGGNDLLERLKFKVSWQFVGCHE